MQLIFGIIIIFILLILLVYINKYISNKLEERKINRILQFFKDNKTNHSDDKLKECIKIIEQNKRKDVKNG